MLLSIVTSSVQEMAMTILSNENGFMMIVPDSKNKLTGPGDIRRLITEYCILPLGIFYIFLLVLGALGGVLLKFLYIYFYFYFYNCISFYLSFKLD